MGMCASSERWHTIVYDNDRLGNAMGAPSSGETVSLDSALSYAWSWFALHSSQRMQLLNFFLITVAFLTTAYATATAAHQDAVAIATAAVGLVTSLAFDRLDMRTRELIVVAERALTILERKVAVSIGIDDMNMSAAASVRSKPATSYRQIISVTTRLFSGLYIAAIVYAAVQLSS
jgi:hypothetical protein